MVCEKPVKMPGLQNTTPSWTPMGIILRCIWLVGSVPSGIMRSQNLPTAGKKTGLVLVAPKRSDVDSSSHRRPADTYFLRSLVVKLHSILPSRYLSSWTVLGQGGNHGCCSLCRPQRPTFGHRSCLRGESQHVLFLSMVVETTGGFGTPEAAKALGQIARGIGMGGMADPASWCAFGRPGGPAP